MQVLFGYTTNLWGEPVARKPNTLLRRRQIVDALCRVMARLGYEHATVQAIAAESGLAPGLIHYHFRDKREILVELVGVLAAYARERYERRASAASTALDRLKAYLDARLAFGPDANPDAVAAWVIIGSEAVRDAEVRALYGEVISGEIATVRTLLRARLHELGRRARGLDRLAAAVLAYTEGVFMLASTVRPLVPRGFAAEMALEWVERYIAAEPRRAP
jgi:TetR/AcrR family transcriptional regulator, transcriptional repressor of bet genes